MLLLAIESAGPACSAALLEDADAAARIVAYRSLEPGQQQADRLVELIDGALADAEVGYSDLNSIAVDHGPGTFTGVRTGVAAARGLALATGLGVLAVGSLEVLACSAEPADRQQRPILSVLDARRGDVYAQAFAAGLRPLGEPAALAPEAAVRLVRGPMLLVGSGASLVWAALPEDADVRLLPGNLDARAVARCAARRIRAGTRPAPGFTLRPSYLRAPDARPQRSWLAGGSARVNVV